jgi:outer membrane biosynthesis protein TonB
MFSSQLLTRAGIAVSVAGHVLFLVWVIFFAGAHPFEPRAVEAIAVDIVTPDEVPQPAKQEPKPTEETPKPPDQLTLPDMEKAKAPEEKAPEEKTKPADPPAQEASAPPPAPAPQAAPTKPPPQQTATAPPQAAAQPPQAAPPSPQPVPHAEPDITEKFGMMFSLPEARGSGDFDAQATDAANVSTNVIAALRSHLKTCTPLPKSVAPADNIQIVLRVSFTPDGHLAADPMLIKGPRPTPKVLALLQGAISGLQACQPYTMLPADKYDEWRNVDLSFTPRDFGG